MWLAIALNLTTSVITKNKICQNWREFWAKIFLWLFNISKHCVNLFVFPQKIFFKAVNQIYGKIKVIINYVNAFSGILFVIFWNLYHKTFQLINFIHKTKSIFKYWKQTKETGITSHLNLQDNKWTSNV